MSDSQKEFADRAADGGGSSGGGEDSGANSGGKDVIHTDDAADAPLDSQLVSSVTLQAVIVSVFELLYCFCCLSLILVRYLSLYLARRLLISFIFLSSNLFPLHPMPLLSLFLFTSRSSSYASLPG